MSFLDQDYELPTTSWWGDYASIEDWKNRFRVLSWCVTWWRYFTQDSENNRKVVRKKSRDEIDLAKVPDGKFWKQTPKHFWAFVVWNYDLGKVQLFELDKATIIEAFHSYLSEKDYSNPAEYDIIIEKQGSWKDTKYLFKVGKHSPIPDECFEEYSDGDIDLEQLFEIEGEPFKKNQ